ncbi:MULTISPECIES: hypothetical protein [unclassified Paenibacillus]|uniref:hypothetical protein n=1 Tax=unclassified Paenibacillus TaxID=185978 RepID=UPI002F3EFAE4
MIRQTVFLTKSSFGKWWGEERGSYSIEAALVVPLLLGIILLFIAAGSYMYQTVAAYYSVATAAERAAFGWDNSNRDYYSGILLEPQYDPLYSKLAANGVLGALFQWSGIGPKQQVAIPAYETAEHNSLADKKLQRAASWLSEKGLGLSGEIEHDQQILSPAIKVTVNKKARGSIESYAQRAVIVDPTEFIRNVHLFAYYTNKLKQSRKEKEQDWSDKNVQGIINRLAGKNWR